MSKAKFTSIGGQALIEGVMMRAPDKTGLCVRQPDGGIYKEYINITSPAEKHKWMKFPLVRGVVGLVTSMMTGYKTLMISAEKSGMNLEDTEAESKFEKWLLDKFGDKLMGIVSAIGMVLGVGLSLLLFFYLPTLMRNGSQFLIEKIIGRPFGVSAQSVYTAIFEGVIKLVIFVVYLALVSRMKEMRRVFEYHGAEHKTIFCFEAGLPLTVDNVAKQRRFHPRCGTSFMVLMMIVGMAFSLTLSLLTKGQLKAIWWTVIKILIVPLVMGLGYEVLKITGKYDNAFIRIISAPGLWIQRLTTKEPDEKQIEVAIASLGMVLPEEDKIRLGYVEEEVEAVEETADEEESEESTEETEQLQEGEPES